MIFADLAAGDSVFLDANTLVYHFGPHPTFGAACSQLVQRIENREIHGFTATHVLAEATHQLMILEASTLPGWTLSKVKKRLQQQPGTLQNLTHFRAAVDSVLQSALQILSIAPALLGTAALISQQSGLLTNDALIVAIMRQYGLSRIASHDTDFDRIAGITRYAPV